MEILGGVETCAALCVAADRQSQFSADASEVVGTILDKSFSSRL